jgi:hypothetical protein
VIDHANEVYSLKLDIQKHSMHQMQSISLEKFHIAVALKVMKELKPQNGREFA